MTDKLLVQLLKNINPLEVVGSLEVPVKEITNDSRAVKPGSVFIAVPGYSADGHDFIDDAVKAGAAAVVAQQPTAGIPVTQVVVENSRRAQAILAAEFFRHPSQHLKLTGVTGTNGKTTSTFMLDNILQAARARTGLMGTLYNKMDGTILPTANTTPDSIVCQRLLNNMATAGVSHVTMEVSSHAMVMHRVDETKFAIGAITNFSPDHLDLHKNMEDYLQAKKSFFDMLPSDGFAVVNADDPGCLRIAETTPAQKLYYSLLNYRADIYLDDYRRRGDGAIVTAKINTDKVKAAASELIFYLGVSGRHNVANSLLAATAGLALGLDVPAIAKGLGTFRGIFRRYETIYNGRYKVIDDATHNPANMNAVFQAISTENPRAVSVVYAIRGNRGVGINKSLAATLRAWSTRIKPKQLIITRCDDTASPLDQVRPEEEQAFRRELSGINTEVQYKETLRQAVSAALDAIRPGETLLLLGAHPMDNVSQVFSELAGVEAKTLPRPPRFGIH